MHRDPKQTEATPRQAALRLIDTAHPSLDVVAAYVMLFVLLAKIPGLSLLPAMALPAFAFLLVPGFFAPTLRATKGTFGLLNAAALAGLFGIVLRLTAPDLHLVTNDPTQLAMIMIWVFGFPTLVLAGYWALERVDVFRGMVVVSAGAVASSIVNEHTASWKGNLGIFVTLFLLALAARNLNRTRLILAGAAVANSLSDSRTMALVAVLVLLCTYLTSKQLSWVKLHPKKALFFIVGGFLLMSFVMAQAMLTGLFGQDIRRRTLLQVSGGRDLITAGRTEWAATLELFKQQPWGFGAGVTPGSGIQTDAIGAVRLAGGDYSNAIYWTYSVFGERTDLHSTLANMWVHFGVGGVVLAATIATIFAGAIPSAIGFVRNLGALPLFAILTGCWDLLFSPMGNSDRIIMAILAAFVLIKLQSNSERVPAPAPRKMRTRPSTLRAKSTSRSNAGV